MELCHCNARPRFACAGPGAEAEESCRALEGAGNSKGGGSLVSPCLDVRAAFINRALLKGSKVITCECDYFSAWYQMQSNYSVSYHTRWSGELQEDPGKRFLRVRAKGGVNVSFPRTEAS